MVKNWLLWTALLALLGASGCTDEGTPERSPANETDDDDADDDTSTGDDDGDDDTTAGDDDDDGAPTTRDAGGGPSPSRMQDASMAGSKRDGATPPASDAAASGTADAGMPNRDAAASVDAGDDGEPATSSCSGKPMLAAGNGSGTIMVGSTQRKYLTHVPRSYDGTKPVPLLLDFHPLGMDAAYQRSNSGYAALADREGFLVIYPDGVNPAWNVGPCCTQSRTVDDVGFAKALVEKFKADACIDSKRVYAAGFSNGGGMTHHLACNAADVFAAFAPAAFDLLVEEEQPCKPVRPVPIKMFRSTNDAIVPYAGGASTPPTIIVGYRLDEIHFRGAVATFEHWAKLGSCMDSAMDTGMGCKTHKQCAAGVEVTLCTSMTAGHKTGPAEQGWEFLKRFTLP